jgi:prostatin (serine protease 8)
MKVFLVALLCVSSALAHPTVTRIGTRFDNPFDTRITNGRDANVGEFPHQISLQWSALGGAYQHVCGGSILTESWILTAGHCITEIQPAGEMKVHAGIVKLVGDVNQWQEANVVERIVHPDYQGGVNPNDIALLRLATPLVFNDLVKPIGLPTAGAIPEGATVLSGWGSTSTGIIANYPNHLQTVDMEIIPIPECGDALTSVLGSPEPLADTNVCTGPLTGAISACSGDSGGPLIQGDVQIGIVSWGVIPCGSSGAPSVYTRVSAFIDFITQHVPQLA